MGWLALPAWAGIINAGNDAVQIEFKKRDGLSQSATLFPGQSMETPSGTESVRVVPRGMGARGDEIILIRVLENSGKETQLTKYGERCDLGASEAEEAPVRLKEGSLTNSGNIALDVLWRQKNGLSIKKTIYPNQALTLPRNIYEVEVLPQVRLRGDEIVRLDAVMPDGSASTITSPGGSARALAESLDAYDAL